MKEAINSRSLRRTHRQIERAKDRRERMLEEQVLSLPSGQGILTIVVSNSPDFKTPVEPKEQVAGFFKEAERLQVERSKDHQHVRIRRRAIPMDVKMELQDPEVSDIVFIGHGSIGDFWTDGNNKHMGWWEVSKATKYLKQGVVEQRTCGTFPLTYNVPFGTFAVASLNNLRAAPNEVVADYNPADSLFVPIYNNTEDVIQQIEVLNERYSNQPPTDKTNVVLGSQPLSSL